MRKYVSILLLQFLFTTVFAQEEDTAPTYKGTISGHVYDETGRVIQDAEVFIYKPDNVAIVGSANTGDDSTNNGGFVTNRIDTGRYNVQLKYAGYRRLIVNSVPIHLNQTTELNLKISPESPEAADDLVLDYINVAVIKKEDTHMQPKKIKTRK
ncbi:MAG: carboxypeptidase regulatory-like domain-containing protein [Bacteroidetes bacterium]|nr:carboxypeptidase regulatory-like domain-containing protein [Bacteroidota bacterium]